MCETGRLSLTRGVSGLKLQREREEWLGKNTMELFLKVKSQQKI